MTNYEKDYDQKSLELQQLSQDNNKANEKIDELKNKMKKEKNKVKDTKNVLKEIQIEVGVEFNRVNLNNYR